MKTYENHDVAITIAARMEQLDPSQMYYVNKLDDNSYVIDLYNSELEFVETLGDHA